MNYPDYVWNDNYFKINRKDSSGNSKPVLNIILPCSKIPFSLYLLRYV